MCGIAAYIGKKQALPILLDGLRRLEYRGYDSAGFSVLNDNKILTVKSVGKIEKLEKKIQEKNIHGQIGIAHTRWATHGAPSEKNAHPHSSCNQDIWVVHNGIIENYQVLKKELLSRGHKFVSETDTEVIAHLLEENYAGNLTAAMEKTLKKLKGAYGLAAIHKKEKKIVAAKKGSPLILGVGDKEFIIASDAAAVIRQTKQVIYLDDGEIVEIENGDFKIYNHLAKEIKKAVSEIEWDMDRAEKNGFPHFMLKEIYEQPQAILDSVRGRMDAATGKAKIGGMEDVKNIARYIEKIIIVACGTARHAGMAGQLMLEEYAGLPATVEYASEFRYRKPILDHKTAVLAISQSGETADTLAAIKEAKEKGALTLGIVNAVGSSIARETDAGVYNHIGPEIAVASTKAYTSQIVILALFTLLFGRQRNMSFTMGSRIIKEIKRLPELIKKTIKLDKQVEKIARKYGAIKNISFQGRKYNYPTAIEAALKLKELSYIYAEGFPAGEMKHGSIALVDEEYPSFFIIPDDSVFEKNLSNMEEIKSRKGRLIAITTEGNDKIGKIADDVLYVPKTLEMLSPIITVIPTQLFAYHMALLNKRDVDKPRNLAKSVTVE